MRACCQNPSSHIRMNATFSCGSKLTHLPVVSNRFRSCQNFRGVRRNRHHCFAGRTLRTVPLRRWSDSIVISASFAGPQQFSNQAAIQLLRDWVEEHGGYIHPDVTLSNSPDFGCRYIHWFIAASILHNSDLLAVLHNCEENKLQ